MPRIKWEEPPANSKRRGSKELIDDEVAAVRSRPGEWAKVREKASSGSYVTYKKRGCTVRTKSVGNQKYAIYIMWDPESDAAKEILTAEKEARIATRKAEKRKAARG